MDGNFSIFCGKASEAEGTVMPTSRAWVRECAADLGSVAPDDHMVAVFMNCPSVGILGAEVTSYMINYITNILSDHPSTGVCFLIHPNRAGQQERTLSCCKGKHLKTPKPEKK